MSIMPVLFPGVSFGLPLYLHAPNEKVSSCLRVDVVELVVANSFTASPEASRNSLASWTFSRGCAFLFFSRVVFSRVFSLAALPASLGASRYLHRGNLANEGIKIICSSSRSRSSRTYRLVIWWQIESNLEESCIAAGYGRSCATQRLIFIVRFSSVQNAVV